MDLTIQELIECYRSDELSKYRKLSYGVRVRHDRLLLRIVKEHGARKLSGIKYRDLCRWHASWSTGNKIAMAQALSGRFRVALGFGFTMLDDQQCYRILRLLEKFKLKSPIPSAQRLGVTQANAIRHWANHIGWHSIALAQAFQFELRLSQRECIGEWIPEAEPANSIIHWRGKKWIDGLSWGGIDDNLILHRAAHKRRRPYKVDPKTCSNGDG